MVAYNCKFESLHKFNVALREVIILIRRFKLEEQKSRTISNIYLKSALVLLTAKLEAFMENIVAEYVQFVNEGLSIEQIPSIIKINHSKEIIEEFNKCYPHRNIESKSNKLCNYMQKLSNVWQNNTEANFISISNKFNYGEHGPEAINDLFERIGINNVLNGIIVVEKKNTIDGEIEESIDLKDKINEIVNKRNQIIHNDSSINFTQKEIISYIKYLKQFSIQLTKILENSLISLIQNQTNL